MRRLHRPRPALTTTALAWVAVPALAMALAACGPDSDGTVSDDLTEDPATTSPGATASPGASGDPDDRGDGGRRFEEENYTYQLDVRCYCPTAGAIRVEVAGGEVVSATSLAGGRGVRAGAEVPEAGRLGIDDVLALADAPGVHESRVTWPAGAAHPTEVWVDRAAGATDDDVTYTISDVRVR